MAETKADLSRGRGPYGPPDERNLGGIGYSGERAPLPSISKPVTVAPNQMGLDSLASSTLENPVVREKKRSTKLKETWYTVHPGISYRTGRFGSDAGVHKGRIEVDTPIREISKSEPVNGIVSIQAEFRVGDSIERGWFSMDDIRGQGKKQRK